MAYNNWMFNIGYGSQTVVANQDHGNPVIPYKAPITAADELKKQKLRACVDVYNKSLDNAQAARITAIVGCIGTSMANKKANGALKLVGILGAVLCSLGVDWLYNTNVDLFKAQYDQCVLDAG